MLCQQETLILPALLEKEGKVKDNEDLNVFLIYTLSVHTVHSISHTSFDQCIGEIIIGLTKTILFLLFPFSPMASPLSSALIRGHSFVKNLHSDSQIQFPCFTALHWWIDDFVIGPRIMASFCSQTSYRVVILEIWANDLSLLSPKVVIRELLDLVIFCSLLTSLILSVSAKSFLDSTMVQVCLGKTSAIGPPHSTKCFRHFLMIHSGVPFLLSFCLEFILIVLGSILYIRVTGWYVRRHLLTLQ